MDDIYDAIHEGDDERALRLLAEWPSLAREVDVLVLAARLGRVAVVDALLAADAPVDTCDEGGFTPLNVAARAGHLEIVRMLIEAGAAGASADLDPEAFMREVIAKERFYEAITTGDVGEMRHLLSDWPHLVRTDDALLLAAETGQADAAAVLLEAGAPKGSDREPRDNPLIVAAGLGHLRIVRMILDGGGGDVDGALPAAALGGSEAMVRWLLDAGAAVDARDQHGRTALWEAAYRGKEAIVRLLLARGADVEARDYTLRLPPLFMAIRAYDLGSVNALLEAGADPQATHDGTGLSALDFAAHSDLTEIRAALQRAIGGP